MERSRIVLEEDAFLSAVFPVLSDNEGLFQNVSRETSVPSFPMKAPQGRRKRAQQALRAFGPWAAALDVDGTVQAEPRMRVLREGLLSKGSDMPGRKAHDANRRTCFPEQLPDAIVLHWGMGH